MTTHAVRLGILATVLTFASWTSAAEATERPVNVLNSTDDVASVRVIVVHFSGSSFHKTVSRGQTARENRVRIGQRGVIVYDANGKILVTGKFELVDGDEPATIGVFGDVNGGYRLDFGT